MSRYYLKAYAVIGYTYEADTHCVACAEARFGEALDDEATVDTEGNNPHPIFASDEWDGGCVCAECGETIVEAEEEEEVEEEEPRECGMCGGPLMELGALGKLMHTRCRNCGMQYSFEL